MTWRAVLVLPQASVAVHVRVTVCLKPVLQSVSCEVSFKVTLAVPAQLSDAVTLAGAAEASQSISTLVGTPTRVGGVTSNVQVTVRDAVPTLPQASVAENVLVCDLEQPVLPTAPSDDVGVKAPLQLSEAVAPPSAPLIVAVDGLHPSDVDDVAVGITTGGVISNVQVTVRDAVPTFPQASVADHVLVCDLAQPVLPTAPSDDVGVRAPAQLSEAVAPLSAPLIVAVDGLHPSAVGAVDVGVTTGGVTSNVQVTVRDAVPTLPQPSVAVHVLVCDLAQPVEPTAPSDAVAGIIPSQLSEAVAPPNAPLIVAVDGLHPRAVDAVDVGVTTGGVMSNNQVTVRDAVPVFPQPSVAVHVLVCDLAQPVLPTAPSDAVGVSAPLQLSEAVAPPSPAFIVAVDGLHPSAVDTVDVGVTTGGVTSNVQVTVRDAVPVLPQASVADHVLVCDRAQPVDPTAPSDEVGVSAPLQLSEAVAPSRAPFIVAVDGLHPSAVDAVEDGVTTGGVTSNVQVTVRDSVAVLPQPSVAVHVLVADLAQPVDPTAPSTASND
jgi:hypothetical protein